MIVGVKTTLRGDRMYDFVNKLVNVALPRVRDFRGLPLKGFDGAGNYVIGIREHNVFPEIRSDEVERLHGLEISLVTTAKNKKEGLELLKQLGVPLQEK